MASAASGLSVCPAGPGTTTERVRHTPWTASVASAADGAAFLPATIATISAAHEITMVDWIVMKSSLGLCRQTRTRNELAAAVSTTAPRASSATTRRNDVARDGAPVGYPQREHDPAS